MSPLSFKMLNLTKTNGQITFPSNKCWVIAAALPWLITTHADPWTTFYNELAACLVSLPLVIWVSLKSQKLQISPSSFFLLAVSTIPLFQLATKVIPFPIDALLSTCYLLGFALSFLIAQNLGASERQTLADGLFSSLLIASIISSGLAAYQWFGLDYLGLLVPSMEIGGSRSVAGIGQPNNLATLLVWGCAASWWGYSRRLFNGTIAFILVAYFLVGISFTGSRTAYIQLAFVGTMAIWHYRSGSAHKIIAVGILAAWFAFLVHTTRLVSSFLWDMQAREIFTAGIRPIFWKMGLEALSERPLFGYGWNQVVAAHLAMTNNYAELSTVMGHSHNLVLDLLLWNGVPIGLAITFAIALWLTKAILNQGNEQSQILTCAVILLFIHACLELPHMYLFFLIPCGLMAGLTTPRNAEIKTSPKKIYVISATATALALTAAVLTDYIKIQEQLAAERFFTARITGAQQPKENKLIVLGSLSRILNPRYIIPRRDMPAHEIEKARNIAIRYPSTPHLYRYAIAAALNERRSEATWALQTICNISDGSICEETIRDWTKFANNEHVENIETPTKPRKL